MKKITLIGTCAALVFISPYGTANDGNTNRSVRQTSEVIDFGDGTAERGGGILTREAQEIWARVSTMDLDPEAAYTVWWIIFNVPRNCLTQFACGEGDIFSAPGVLNIDQITKAKIAVVYADGFVTGADGVANVYAHLKAGRLPEGTWVNFWWGQFLPGSESWAPRALGVNRGLGAEVHMVVRSHDDAVAGIVGRQTTTFIGGCPGPGPTDPISPVPGAVCDDQLAIVFRAP